MDGVENELLVRKILTANELNYIVAQATEPGSEIVDYHIRTASDDGLKGFVGDHFRMTITVRNNDCLHNISLFIKTLPIINKPKADFIVRHQFFKREALMFELIKDMRELDGQVRWHTTAFIHNDKILVMPDLSVHGYKTYPVQEYLDKSHVLAAASSVALFHASFAKSFTEKRANDNHEYNFLREYGDVMTEPNFCESSWLRAAAKLTNNFLKEFSTEPEQYPTDLEEKLWSLFIRGCESLKECEDTLNVIIHKDLWANNILFKYSGEEITDAVLVDFQCVRYAPPAFDLMTLLYLTTSKSFRERYENEVLHCYYSKFVQNLDDLTTERLRDLSYDLKAFLVWCERARLFGMIIAIGIFPFILMDPDIAQITFDDPLTFEEYLERDRTEPVLAHARLNIDYRNRQLEVCEELFEKYIKNI